MKYTFVVALAVALLALPQARLSAQNAKTYRGRLSPVPIDVTMAATIAGSGAVTAVLNGSRLTVNGTYEGLKSAATTVQLHMAQRGVRGPAVLDLKASGGTSGTIAGTVELTAQLQQDLQNSRLYVQLQSEKAPEGNLWGWLMPSEIKK
jgi:CHRD domain-containing protein